MHIGHRRLVVDQETPPIITGRRGSPDNHLRTWYYLGDFAPPRELPPPGTYIGGVAERMGHIAQALSANSLETEDPTKLRIKYAFTNP